MKEVINSRAAMCDSSLRELEAKQVRDTIARQMHTGQGKQEWKKTISLIGCVCVSGLIPDVGSYCICFL